MPTGIDALVARHVLIGWKDTREARRAVQDALPFLHEAERGATIEVCAAALELQARAAVSDVEQYLSRHRIRRPPALSRMKQGPRMNRPDWPNRKAPI